jgi:tetratricopeptide repeat protein 21B
LEDKRDFGIVWHLAIVSAHNKCKYVDKEAIAALEAKKTIKSNQVITERANVLAGWFCLMTKKYLDAQGYFSTVLAENPNSVTALAGNAWIQVFTGALSQGNPFEQCLDKSIRDLESLVGYSHYLRSTKKLKEALNTVNTIIGYYPNFLPAFIERMNIHFEMQNWEAVLESAQRLGGMSPENIDSMLMISLYELCCEGTSDSISTYLDTTKKVLIINVGH